MKSALLCCPACKSELSAQDTSMNCLGCGNRYPLEQGIPILIPARAMEEANTEKA